MKRTNINESDTTHVKLMDVECFVNLKSSTEALLIIFWLINRSINFFQFVLNGLYFTHNNDLSIYYAIFSFELEISSSIHGSRELFPKVCQFR